MPQNAARLVVVDDDPDIRSMIADFLTRDGYEIRACSSGAEFDRTQSDTSADLVVLDVCMPGEDGIAIARRLRAAGRTPIIMLSARDDIVDRIVGLEAGADDYLPKPFDLRELRARVRALLRRANPSDPINPCANASLVCFGKVCLDLEAGVLVGRDGNRLRLTATEFDLLATFARSPNKVLSRQTLLDRVQCKDRYIDRAIDIRVARIRKKVEVDPTKPRVIRTIRNSGYMFVAPSKLQS